MVRAGPPGIDPAVVDAAIGPPQPGSTRATDAARPSLCPSPRGALGRARLVLQDRYTLGSFPAVRLPHDLTWREDPFHDPNWVFRLHGLEPVQDLIAATASTGDTRFIARAIALARDWAGDNVTARPPSPYSWNDHSTAMRAIRLACLADARPSLVAVGAGGSTPWLRRLLVRHGAKLADPGFYVRVGNHALNQSIGLLEVGRVVGRADWRRLAARRIANLAAISIDRQGVTNEQAVGYQAFNWSRYSLAIRRLRVAGITPASSLQRVALMPGFLVHATLPDGTVEMLGDTIRTRGLSIAGTPNEYASSAGASGPRPTKTVVRYQAGFLFARTGWGVHRAPRDETFLSLRFGPAPRFHGHADGGSITLYGWGSRLLVDPGLYTYGKDSPWRKWIGGPARPTTSWPSMARHGGRARRRSWTRRRRRPSCSRACARPRRRVSLTCGRWPSRGRSAMSSWTTAWPARRRHVFRQLWHLVQGSAPTIDGRTVRTHRDRGNLVIRQLAAIRSTRIVKGSVSPIQGWISYRYRQKVAAPVVETTVSGSTGQFLTLLVPGAGTPAARIGSLRLTATGYSVVVTVGGRSERVQVRGRRGDDHAAVLREAIRVTHGYDPCVTRFYDLDEADALVPELQTRCARLRDQREDLIAIRDELAIGEASLEGAAASGGGSGGTLPDKDDDIRRLRLRMRGLVDQMQAEVAWLDERSVRAAGHPVGAARRGGAGLGAPGVALLAAGRGAVRSLARADHRFRRPPADRRAGMSASTGGAAPDRGERRTVLQDGRAKAYRPLPVEKRVAAYRAGIAAYRRGDFFEAHELLEPAWMGTDEPTERALHQGLIKLAAGFVHAVRGNPEGVRKNLVGARQRLVAAEAGGAASGVAGGRIRGLDLDRLIADIDARTLGPRRRPARHRGRRAAPPPRCSEDPHDRSGRRPSV